MENMILGLRGWGYLVQYNNVYDIMPLEQWKRFRDIEVICVDKIERKSPNGHDRSKNSFLITGNKEGLGTFTEYIWVNGTISENEKVGNRIKILELELEGGSVKLGQYLLYRLRDNEFGKSGILSEADCAELPYLDDNFEKEKGRRSDQPDESLYKPKWDAFLELVFDEGVKKKCYEWMKEHPDDLPDARCYELEADGEIVGEAEVAWTRDKRVILSKEQEEYSSIFTKKGWKIV